MVIRLGMMMEISLGPKLSSFPKPWATSFERARGRGGEADRFLPPSCSQPQYIYLVPQHHFQQPPPVRRAIHPWMAQWRGSGPPGPREVRGWPYSQEVARSTPAAD